MAEPRPTTDTEPTVQSPGIKKLPPWAIVAIVVAGIGIAILYKKNKEEKESYFQPTSNQPNRPFEPGFGASGAGGLPETSRIGTEPAAPIAPFIPIAPESTNLTEPQPVAATPATQEVQHPGLTPNQINALNKGYPVVTSNVPQGPYVGAQELVEHDFPTEAQHIAYVQQSSYYVQPAPNYPVIPTPAQYPGAFQYVAEQFSGPGGTYPPTGETQIQYGKSHSHYA